MRQNVSQVDLDSIHKFAKNWLCDSFFWGRYDIFKKAPLFDPCPTVSSTMPVNYSTKFCIGVNTHNFNNTKICWCTIFSCWFKTNKPQNHINKNIYRSSSSYWNICIPHVQPYNENIISLNYTTLITCLMLFSAYILTLLSFDILDFLSTRYFSLFDEHFSLVYCW